MKEFLSEENIDLHREYVRQKKLKYSIIEGSVSELCGAEVKDIYRMKISARDKTDAIDLLSEITAHDIFFSSFCDIPYPRSETVAKAYGSEANFLNFLYRLCLKEKYGFVFVYLIGDRIEVKEFYDIENAFRHGTPILAIDVCEHAYFMDYGFDKERYLLSSLPYLDISKLTVR